MMLPWIMDFCYNTSSSAMIEGRDGMAKSEKQKLKIFYIADYLMRETDDELDENDRPIHGVLMKDI